MCFKAWFPYAAELPAELPTTVPIGEEKWLATNAK